MAKEKLLAEAIKTIGRTLPVGMEVFFFRDEGADGAGMTINLPGGELTEYRFLQSEPLLAFAQHHLTRDTQIEAALRDLLASIELHTDCMTGEIDSAAIADQVETAEELLAEAWVPDESHPANQVTSQPATASSLGEPLEVS